MTLSTELQPDQRPGAWDDHVSLYEEVFEPLSLAFAQDAAARLGPVRDRRVLDVAAGAGGAALALAHRGALVTAVDASAGMVARTRQRAEAEDLALEAAVMDGTSLAFMDGSFDAALSVFGVILFPDAARGLAEVRRVVRPGGRIAIVTWTQPHRYELAAHLREAIAELRIASTPPAQPPAQLRFVEPDALERLFAKAGMSGVEIETREASMAVPSARWLVERIRFAPGMAAWMAGLGSREDEALHVLRARLERAHGMGPFSLGAAAMIGAVQA